METQTQKVRLRLMKILFSWQASGWVQKTNSSVIFAMDSAQKRSVKKKRFERRGSTQRVRRFRFSFSGGVCAVGFFVFVLAFLFRERQYFLNFRYLLIFGEFLFYILNLNDLVFISRVIIKINIRNLKRFFKKCFRCCGLLQSGFGCQRDQRGGGGKYVGIKRVFFFD